MNSQILRARFLTFAEKECMPASPLYASLARGVAEDAALLELAAHTQPSQPVPLMLFAAVQYLLLGEARQPLAEFYPTLTAQPRTGGDMWPHFHEFCLAHRESIEALLAARLVQTNEVRRCTCLLPAFARVQALAKGKPLALMEIGASAGLNLLWDRYRYEFSDGRRWGQEGASVALTCEMRGALAPLLPATPVNVVARLGLDLNPINVSAEDEVRWLRALIWPEQVHRTALLQHAIAVAQAERPALWRGDALELLPRAFARTPPEAALCVWHSFTLNQFSPENRQRVAEMLTTESLRRTLFRIAMEWGTDCALLSLSTFERGVEHATLLARCDPHGSWLEWQ